MRLKCLLQNSKLEVPSRTSRPTMPLSTFVTDAKRIKETVRRFKAFQRSQKAPVLSLWKSLKLNDNKPALAILRLKFANVQGLQYPGNGACVAGCSLPRFVPVTRPFIQVIHLPDHWLCAANVLSENPADVWIFDSMQGTSVPNLLTTQLTSLLRLYEKPDTVVLR
jgi:hypothetical protein